LTARVGIQSIDPDPHLAWPDPRPSHSSEGGDYATVLGTLCLSSGQHSWNVYINHVEDSNLFIGVSVGGHDLNADPQEMKHRTYYLSNG